MLRPPSIVRFERLYLLGLALSLGGWALEWGRLSARLSDNPQTAAYGWMLPLAMAVSAGITIVLWYLVARRGSLVAKWLVTLFAALALFRFLFAAPALLGGALSPSLLLSAATTILSVAAAAMLFRPDARAWFEEDGTQENGAQEEEI